ncbi:hypothetical protein IP98_01330 [Flavobacterium cauense R2A-7]|uniref:ATP-grasp domain-containing protein n=1 Tax=Flavobacterium cauense R2A-7 TaxID=1341154 RepID=A0A562LZ01_9FLAO|nr:hypothetical protein [Flavobacterium cauense]TWI12856.1 hypothetical protein IP98_01330 [Flavobacterium cauense R2A-7]
MNKNLIIISERNDKSTNNVLEWLDYYDIDFERKNVDSDRSDFCIRISTQETTTSVSDCIVWNRRGYMSLLPTHLKKSEWIGYLKKEQFPVLATLEKSNPKNYIGSYVHELENNKLNNLQAAAKVGLEIPKTIVTNNKQDLLNFVEVNKKYITKSLVYSPFLEKKDCYYKGNGTIVVDFEKVSEYFAPSLIQEYIDKEIEIRIFFILDNFYAMAIFSQNDLKTQIDFRNYNDVSPNRCVPFELEATTLAKIKEFVSLIGCNSGSIDLILTPENKFVFLEINPMGQYHWLSESCNYYVDKHIAELLIEKVVYE